MESAFKALGSHCWLLLCSLCDHTPEALLRVLFLGLTARCLCAFLQGSVQTQWERPHFHPPPGHSSGPLHVALSTAGMTQEAWGSQHPLLSLTQFSSLRANGQPGQMTKRCLNSRDSWEPGIAASWEPAPELCNGDHRRAHSVLVTKLHARDSCQQPVIPPFCRWGNKAQRG